jgi:hypothetical protein
LQRKTAPATALPPRLFFRYIAKENRCFTPGSAITALRDCDEIVLKGPFIDSPYQALCPARRLNHALCFWNQATGVNEYSRTGMFSEEIRLA